LPEVELVIHQPF